MGNFMQGGVEWKVKQLSLFLFLEFLWTEVISLYIFYTRVVMSLKRERLIEGFHQLAQGHSEYQYQSATGHTFNCIIRQYFADILNNKSEQMAWDQLAKQFQPSECMPLPGEVLGKRSSEIFLSASRNYCIKMIDKETLQHMQELFPVIMQYKNNATHDYLLDIYKIIEVEALGKNFTYHDYFMVMPSIRGLFQQSICVYDLKGYLEARMLAKGEYEDFKFGKDQNFVISQQIKMLREIPANKLQELAEGLQQTILFLEKLNIIDYSLLISFEHNGHGHGHHFAGIPSIEINQQIIMKWGIIDYFQVFNKKKMMEKSFKTLFRKEVSSEEPNRYAQRFIQFIQLYILQSKLSKNPAITCKQ